MIVIIDTSRNGINSINFRQQLIDMLTRLPRSQPAPEANSINLVLWNLILWICFKATDASCCGGRWRFYYAHCYYLFGATHNVDQTLHIIKSKNIFNINCCNIITLPNKCAVFEGLRPNVVHLVREQCYQMFVFL